MWSEVIREPAVMCRDGAVLADLVDSGLAGHARYLELPPGRAGLHSHGHPRRPPFMVMHFRLRDGMVAEVRFQTFGCVPASRSCWEAVRKLLRPGMTTLEFGSGLSTLLFEFSFELETFPAGRRSFCVCRRKASQKMGEAPTPAPADDGGKP